MKNQKFIDLANAMLVKNALSRLSKFSAIKSSPYFSDFNFENLLSLSITPPYFPEVDTSKNKSDKLVTFIYYMKTGLTEYKLPDNFKPNKSKTKEYDDWYKNF